MKVPRWGVSVARKKQATTKKSRPSNSKRKRKAVKQPSFAKRWLRRALTFLLTVSLLGVLTFFGAYLYFARDLPNHRNYQFVETTRMFSADGVVIRELYPTNPTERRTVVPIAELPSVVVDAVLAAEDADFYSHEGLDYLGMIRALYKMVTRGKISGGGSTITQQTVKNMLLKPERKFKRKFKELILARRLEASLTKDEILHIYLNIIYLGHGRHGIEEAAQYYFGVPARELSLSQAATIAGLIQSPEKHSPRKHPKSAKTRQTYVLKQMVRKGFLGDSEAKAEMKRPLPKLAPPPKSYDDFRWFTDLALKKLLKSYDLKTIQTGGYRIDTTLDTTWQLAAQTAIRDTLDKAIAKIRKPERVKLAKWKKKRRKQLGRKAPPIGVRIPGAVVSRDKRFARLALGKGEGVLKSKQLRRWERMLGRDVKVGDLISIVIEKPQKEGKLAQLRLASLPEAAMAVMDPASGNVKALIGGYDWRVSKFNRAIQMRRQIGSTFKPFVYAAAIQSRHYTLATTLLDSPETIALGGGKIYSPQNYSKKYLGEVSLRTAFAKSINTTAIRTTLDLTTSKVIDFATQCGLSGPYPKGPSLALGAIESSPYILTQAFTAFANEGHRVEPRLITRLSRKDEVIERFKSDSTSVMSEGVAYLMREALVEVVQNGTARSLRNLPQTVGGKTGTTNKNRDAWFVGITPSMVSAVWVGRDNNQRLWKKATGGSAAAPIFKQFVTRIKPTGLEFPSQPESVVKLSVDKNGLRVRDKAPSDGEEFFLVGTEPKFAPKAEPSLDSLWDDLDMGDESDSDEKTSIDNDGDDDDTSETAPTLTLFNKAEPTPAKNTDKQTDKKPKPNQNADTVKSHDTKKKTETQTDRSLFDEDTFE